MLVTEGIYRFSGMPGAAVWGANIYLLVGETLTLVDTGFRGRVSAIVKQVVGLGYSPYDIDGIIITHHHADHIGNLAELKDLTQAKVYAHKDDAPYIDGRLAQPGPMRPWWLRQMLSSWRGMWATVPAGVDILLDDGDELPVMGGIKVLHTPGHTPGSIALYLKRQKVVIAGDLLAHRFFVRLPSRMFTTDIAREIDSIKKLAELDFEIICFGHGLPITRNAHETVAKLAKRLGKKHGKITESESRGQVDL